MKLQLEVKGTTDVILSNTVKVKNLKFCHLMDLESNESLADRVFDREYEGVCREFKLETVEVIITEIKVLSCTPQKKWAEVDNDTPV